MHMIKRSAIAAMIGAALVLAPTLAAAQQVVRIGMGAPTLSFLPIWAARALDTFKAEGLTATVAALPGGCVKYKSGIGPLRRAEQPAHLALQIEILVQVHLLPIVNPRLC